MTPPSCRRPRVFAADDPAILRETQLQTTSNNVELPVGATPVSQRPIQSSAKRRTSWGGLLVSSLVTAASIAAGVRFARFISLAFARDDWIGWTVTGLIAIAIFAALMMLVREMVGFSRLSRLSRIKQASADALRDRDRRAEQKAIAWLMNLYSGRRNLAWSLRRLQDYAHDVHDPGNLLSLADRELMSSLDGEARRTITRSAKRVATVTAMSPMALISVAYVLIENLRTLRSLATLYGGRPGFVGVVRLARMIFTHLVATGGVAMTDDLLGQFLGHDVLRRLSQRLGEGAFNGALTARFGIAAIEVIRPLPFLEARPVRVRDVLTEVFRKSEPNARGAATN
jgi:putative membrane protein